MSPQAVSPGLVRADLVLERDAKYNISSDGVKSSRLEIPEEEMINPLADYWKQHGKGFGINIEETEMKLGHLFLEPYITLCLILSEQIRIMYMIYVCNYRLRG